jgi:hypothetical protein
MPLVDNRQDRVDEICQGASRHNAVRGTQMTDPVTTASPSRKQVRYVSSCSERDKKLLYESFRLVVSAKPEALAKLEALEAWLRANGDVVNWDFIIEFCKFWHEAIIAGLDTEALLDLALHWHLTASAQGYTRPQASRYWLTVRALEELGMFDSPITKSKRRHR